MKRTLVTTAAVLALGFGLATSTLTPAFAADPATEATTAAPASSIVEVTDDLQSALEGLKTPALVVFTRDGDCADCAAANTQLAETASRFAGRLTVMVVNVTQHPDLNVGLSDDSLPAATIFDPDLGQIVGFAHLTEKSLSTLDDALTSVLDQLAAIRGAAEGDNK